MACATADAVSRVPDGCDFSYHCHDCNSVVVIAPSSIRLLKEDPSIVLLCQRCLPKRNITVFEPRIAAPIEELLHEIRTAKPNTWRNRN
jgi:hypothetical protein